MRAGLGSTRPVSPRRLVLVVASIAAGALPMSRQAAVYAPPYAVFRGTGPGLLVGVVSTPPGSGAEASEWSRPWTATSPASAPPTRPR